MLPAVQSFTRYLFLVLRQRQCHLFMLSLLPKMPRAELVKKLVKLHHPTIAYLDSQPRQFEPELALL
jgi:hypothetical protein